MTTPSEPEVPPNEPEDEGPDAPLRAAMYAVAAVGGAFTLGAFLFIDTQAGLSVLAGAIIAVVNLLAFARIVHAFLGKTKRTAPWALLAVLKLLVLFGGIFLLVKSELVSALWLAAGYAALPFGITLGSLLGPKPPEGPETPS